MTDSSVAAALRTDAPLVVIEAPAGCGKTHQAADYARDVGLNARNRVLVLTHTHAACGVFADRTTSAGQRVEIRTIDSLIAQIAATYYAGLGLPKDVAAWTRKTKNGYALVAERVATLIKRHPMISAAIAKRYSTIICDEHQDCSGDQHALVIALLQQGSRLRIFGDPMQHIFRDENKNPASPPCDWEGLLGQANVTEGLDTPHRWTAGCPELGKWVLNARKTLKEGGRIDLTSNLPPSITVLFAENVSMNTQRIQYVDAKPVYTFEKEVPSLLVLTRYNAIARACRGMFSRRLLLWEGHTRSALEALVDAITDSNGAAISVAKAVVAFMSHVGTGFSPSAFGNLFLEEASSGCVARRKGKSAKIQDLARHIVAQPDHRGVAAMLRELSELKDSDSSFKGIKLDHHNEFWEAVHLGQFDGLDEGLAQITHRRNHSSRRPPEKAISTIHKAKGLECGSVILMPVDAKTFPDKFDARCLLYVALSRAKERLLIVASRTSPSPLFVL